MALIFALLIVPIAFMVGVAIDYSRATLLESQISRAADAAVIAAVNKARDMIAGGMSDKKAVEAAKSNALTVYAGMLPAGVSADGAKLDLDRKGTAVSAKLAHKAQSPNAFMGILGKPHILVGTEAGAAAQLSAYVDVALLVDTSGSMALGADDAAVKTLTSQLGCAFACHDGAPVKGTSMDAYEWATANGIKLRTQAINSGIVSFIDFLKTKDPGSALYRVAIYSFSDSLTQLMNYSANLESAKKKLPSQTNAASELTGATHFAEIMPAFTAAVGSGGDGATQIAPKRLAIIATDGVQDPNRTWTTNVPLRALVAPFDPNHCAALKAAGVSVGVIHTPYLPMSWDWGYQATLGQPSQIGGSGTRQDDIAGQLRKCASPGLYVLADTADLGSAFQIVFESFTQSRITR